MKVKELIKMLECFPPDMNVLVRGPNFKYTSCDFASPIDVGDKEKYIYLDSNCFSKECYTNELEDCF